MATRIVSTLLAEHNLLKLGFFVALGASACNSTPDSNDTDKSDADSSGMSDGDDDDSDKSDTSSEDDEDTSESDSSSEEDDEEEDDSDSSKDDEDDEDDSTTPSDDDDSSSESEDDSTDDEDDDSSSDDDDSTGDDDDEDDDSTEDPDLHVFENDCQRVLADVIDFYNGQRCGDAHNWLIEDNPNGNECHSDDGEDFGAELSGGWHDAGDYIKFTLTNGASAYQLLKAYDAFPSSFKDRNDYENSGEPNDVPDVLDQTQHALDYLEKVLLASGEFVNRVGSDEDHANWVTSPYDWKVLGTERTVFKEGKADVAGISAAALALGSRTFARYDKTRSQAYLKAAKAQYEFALANTGTTPDNFYEDNTWKDSVFCGAIELYRATKEDAYLEKAKSLNEELGKVNWVLDWSNSMDLCRHSLQVAGDGKAGERLSEIINDFYLPSVSSAPEVDGLAYFDLQWGSLRYANNAAFSSGLAWSFVSGSDKERFAEFTASQVEFALGDNPYDRSFIVGIGDNPPTEPHHQLAYGEDMVTFPTGGKPRFTITGALVGGPSPDQGYEDSVANYVTNEVTIDYNAAIATALAALAHMDEVEAFGSGVEHCSRARKAYLSSARAR